MNDNIDAIGAALRIEAEALATLAQKADPRRWQQPPGCLPKRARS
ncbi:hypothetical protein [Tessaracoccus coleopterorum]|nr:hypothetical protein [Tessaracoccus coleopterorum]